MSSSRHADTPVIAIPVLAVCALIGAGWLVFSVFGLLARADVLAHGGTANAEVLEYRTGSRGASDRATVRFSTAAGEEIVTDVRDPPTDPRPPPQSFTPARRDPCLRLVLRSQI